MVDDFDANRRPAGWLRSETRDSFLGAFGKELDGLRRDCFWSAIWERPGLDLRGRVVLAISLLMAGGKSAERELAAIFRDAVSHRVLSVDETMEIILHAAGYLGFPVARSAFRIALRELAPLVEQDNHVGD